MSETKALPGELKRLAERMRAEEDSLIAHARSGAAESVRVEREIVTEAAAMIERLEAENQLLLDAMLEASRLCNHMHDDGPWGRIERVDAVLRGTLCRIKLQEAPPQDENCDCDGFHTGACRMKD